MALKLKAKTLNINYKVVIKNRKENVYKKKKPTKKKQKKNLCTECKQY